MKTISILGIGSALILSATALLAQEDVKESKDHPLLSRMPGYYISTYDHKEFDSHKFSVFGPDGKTETRVEIEGRKTCLSYRPRKDTKAASPLQILRNCQNAITKIEGKVAFEVGERGSTVKGSTLQLARGGQETWVEVDIRAGGGLYYLTIIEKGEMQQVVTASAEAWLAEMASTGHATAQGIYFDQGKADLKPESEEAFKEIAKLLQQDPGLKLLVVGHTDIRGDMDANMKLSEERAAAVVSALTSRHGVAGTRLSPYGVGPLSPVAPNDTEEGRAKNRRVELVRQ